MNKFDPLNLDNIYKNIIYEIHNFLEKNNINIYLTYSQVLYSYVYITPFLFLFKNKINILYSNKQFGNNNNNICKNTNIILNYLKKFKNDIKLFHIDDYIKNFKKDNDIIICCSKLYKNNEKILNEFHISHGIDDDTIFYYLEQNQFKLIIDYYKKSKYKENQYSLEDSLFLKKIYKFSENDNYFMEKINILNKNKKKIFLIILDWHFIILFNNEFTKFLKSIKRNFFFIISYHPCLHTKDNLIILENFLKEHKLRKNTLLVNFEKIPNTIFIIKYSDIIFSTWGSLTITCLKYNKPHLYFIYNYEDTKYCEKNKKSRLYQTKLINNKKLFEENKIDKYIIYFSKCVEVIKNLEFKELIKKFNNSYINSLNPEYYKKRIKLYNYYRGNNNEYNEIKYLKYIFKNNNEIKNITLNYMEDINNLKKKINNYLIRDYYKETFKFIYTDYKIINIIKKYIDINNIIFLGVGGNCLTLNIDENKVLKILNINIKDEIFEFINKNKLIFGDINFIEKNINYTIYIQNKIKYDIFTSNNIIINIQKKFIKNNFFFPENLRNNIRYDKNFNLFIFDWHDIYKINDNLKNNFILLLEKNFIDNDIFIDNNIFNDIFYFKEYQRFYINSKKEINLLHSTQNKYNIIKKLFLQDKNIKNTIDLGCAQGILSLKLAQENSNILCSCINNNSKELKIGNKVKIFCNIENINILNKSINFYDLSSIKQSFDLVLCYSFIHHFLRSIDISIIKNYLYNLTNKYVILEVPLFNDSCLNNFITDNSYKLKFNCLKNINNLVIEFSDKFDILEYNRLNYFTDSLYRYYLILKKK